MINVILTAAGKYERFKRFSYSVPKYLLPIKDRTLLYYVCKSFYKLTLTDTKCTFVGNKNDIQFEPIIEETLGNFFPYDIQWVGDTKGQAQTLAKSIDFLEKKENIIVHNIDTVLAQRSWNEIGAADCVVDVFNSSNRDYSYVIENDGLVLDIREKSVISERASSGCYYFKDDKFLNYITEETNYISEIIKSMIDSGLKVVSSPVYSAESTIVFGTPEEYIANINNSEMDKV